MLSNRTSRWSLATAALCVALIAASWFLLIGPRRSQASELAADQVTAQQQNDALRQRIAQLQAQMADLPQRQAELASIRRQLPAAPNVPRLVRDLRSLADASGVTLGAVTPADPVVLDADHRPAGRRRGRSGHRPAVRHPHLGRGQRGLLRGGAVRQAGADQDAPGLPDHRRVGRAGQRRLDVHRRHRGRRLRQRDDRPHAHRAGVRLPRHRRRRRCGGRRPAGRGVVRTAPAPAAGTSDR